MNDYTTLLFANPSCIEGWARLLDFGNFLDEYNVTDDPDRMAILSDWQMVGIDMQNAIEEYEAIAPLLVWRRSRRKSMPPHSHQKACLLFSASQEKNIIKSLISTILLR